MSGNSKLIWNCDSVEPALRTMLETLECEYPLASRGRGLKLKFRRVDRPDVYSRVSRSTGEFLVEYNSLQGAARGVGGALAGLTGEEITPFKTLGIMLDVSRNMVMRVDHLKSWLRRLALAGHNMVMLYTEDVYELEEYAHFGWMRGAYTIEEIQELDAYAARLGIEMIGCIQTLGHLEQILQWSEFSPVRDTASVLMVDAPETYRLIGSMLDFWKAALTSRRIHIGMDETHDLGRGRFLDHFGYERAFDLFNRHLGKVNAMCAERGLAPMIWSDMYFRLSNPNQEYYNLDNPIPDDVRRKIPAGVQLVYWDYYHERSEVYAAMIRAHKELGFVPVMGSGIWTWTKLWYDHNRTHSTAAPCIAACRAEGVTELFFTMWGDDGAYCNYDSALAGIAYTADLAFGTEDLNRTAERFEAVCGGDFAVHIAAGELDFCLDGPASPDRAGVYPERQVIASALLWDDPLQGIVFDSYKRLDPEFDLKTLDHYEELLCRIMPESENGLAGDVDHAVNMLRLLIRKLELRGALEAAYDAGDRIALREIAAAMVPAAVAALRKFDESFRRQWLACAKPFGLERIQARNAGLAARLEELARRIQEFLDGEIDCIEELEARLPASAPFECFRNYRGVSSVSYII